MQRDGITTIGHLQERSEFDLVSRYGSIGTRLFRFARDEDDRKVVTGSKTKSISSETTFSTDHSDPIKLQEQLRPLCESVARRLRNKQLTGLTVTVKLKGTDFQLLTRSRRLSAPTQQADAIFDTAAPLLRKEANGRAFRLIGVGVADLMTEADGDQPDLFAAADP